MVIKQSRITKTKLALTLAFLLSAYVIWLIIWSTTLKRQCMGVGDPAWENVQRIQGDGSLQLDWENLHNPILGFESHRLKDQAVAFHDGYFYIFAGKSYRSPDLRNWEEIPPAPPGDLVSTGDIWILTHQIPFPDEPQDSKFRKVAWRQSTDLHAWSEDRDLLLLPKDRNIDPTLAFLDDGRVALVYKQGVDLQESRVAYGVFAGEHFTFGEPQKAYAGEGCILDKIIPPVGDLITRWAENAQIIRIDGQWRVIATARHPDRPIDTGYVGSHEPFIYEISGDDFSQWTHKRHLRIPQESWNTLMHANTAFLLDLRAKDSWFYLFYSGADRLDPDGRGHGKIGVARSRDLITWVVPGEATGMDDRENKIP